MTTKTRCSTTWRSAIRSRARRLPPNELTIYRFADGGFTKLDSSLTKMVQKDDAIAFETSPLTVKGRIANKNQVQFQNGHLYVFKREIPAGEFKAKCLALFDEVETHGRELIVTKRGRPVARVVPLYTTRRSLAGSLVHEEDLLSPVDVLWQANER